MVETACPIGQRIYDLRIERDVQQGELARAIHLHQSVLNRIEKGTRPARDVEICAIANFFHVSADFLLGLTSLRYDPASDTSSCVAEHADTPFTILSPEEDTLIQSYRQLDRRGRATVQGIIRIEQPYKEAI